MKKLLSTLFVCLCVGVFDLSAQDVSYQRPPKEIEEIALAKHSPAVSFSESYKWMLQLERAPYYSVEELAQPELRLAGVRINPNGFCGTRQRGFLSATFVNVDTKTRLLVKGFPEEAVIIDSWWYPKTDKVLFALKEADGIYLYASDVTEGIARKVTSRRLNATMGIDIHWLNPQEFMTLMVPATLGAVPAKSLVPAGPIVQENIGKKVAARTYPDLLKNKYDEQLFDYYFTSQLVRVSQSGEKEIGEPGIWSRISLSPDKSLMLVERTHRPYSYVLPMSAFPSTLQVADLDGNIVKTLAETPLQVPVMGYDTTSPYPRGYNWRADKPATVYWIEAQDGGDPRKMKVDYMDIVYQQAAPFTQPREVLAKTRLRYRGIQWGDDAFALLSEGSSATRRMRTYSFVPASQLEPKLIFDYSTDDNYNNPGRPVTVKNSFDRWVLYTDKSHNELLLLSSGASPSGDMPFLSRYELAKKKNTILWRCQAPYYETIYDVTDPVKLEMITTRQSVTEPMNYYRRELKKKKVTCLTDFTNPYPMLQGVSKEKIRYKRADGVELTATVYLPAGYDKEKEGPLPVLMWAYPREYNSASDAGQVRGSQYTFTMINYGSPVFWVTRGFCVMDNVEMPIVGSKGVEPNDNFIDQLVMNAEAAVKVIAEMGVGDSTRVAIGGHSYGAFMTANLLTHTHLFKAGIARSGAYNRTLTPFGFQAERRTYWEAPEVYNAMSPFAYADKLSGALLMIHGELDNNTGTFPIQSERLYQALKGHGATVRYVVLPYESHSYSAKENILHLLYEEDAWLHTYVKNAGRTVAGHK